MDLGVAKLRRQLRNPIFSRELLTTLRRPRGFAILAVALVVSAAAVLSAWPQPQGVVNQGELSRTIFGLFAAAQMLVLGFVIPGTLAASMTSEKEGETIDLLLTTPVSGDTIVAGKLLSGLGFFLLLGLASAPVLMLCSVIGGLGLEDVVLLYAALSVQGLAYGLTCIACSAFSRRTVMAVMIAYILVAFEAAFLVPVYDDLPATCVRALFICLPAFLVARRGVRLPYNPVPKPMEEPKPEAAGLVLQPDAFPDKFLLPPPRRGPMKDGINPIYIKELQAGIHGSGSRFVRVLIQLGVVMGLIVFIVALVRSADAGVNASRIDTGHVFIAFAAAFAMTLGPAIGARAFSGEREEGTAEMLCMVILPRWAIVRGKFFACLRVVVTLTAINCVAFLPYAFLSGSWFQGLVLAVIITSVSATSIAVGFLCSLHSPTTITAMLRSYALLFVLWIGPALGSLYLSGGGRLGLDLFLRVLTPFHAAGVSFSGREEQMLVKLICLALHVAVSAGVTAALLAWCAKNFDKTMRVVAEQ